MFIFSCIQHFEDHCCQQGLRKCKDLMTEEQHFNIAKDTLPLLNKIVN